MGSMVNSGCFHERSACSRSSEVRLAPPANSLLLANREATVVLLSLSPMPKFLALLLELALLLLEVFLFLSLLLLLPTLLTEELEDGEEAIEEARKERYTVIKVYIIDILTMARLLCMQRGCVFFLYLVRAHTWNAHRRRSLFIIIKRSSILTHFLTLLWQGLS